MKKKVGYFLLVLVALLLVLYVIRYKTKPNFKNTLPQNTTALVHVDLRKLEHHFVKDFVLHPLDYIKGRSKPKDSIDKDSISIRKAIKIPRSLLFYSVDSTASKTWMTPLIRVKNKSILSTLLIKNDFKKHHINNISVFIKDDICFLANHNSLMGFYNAKYKDDLLTYFNDQGAYLDETSELYRIWKSNKSDFCYISKNGDLINGNFNNGQMIVEGKFTSSLFTAVDHQIAEENIAQLATKFNVQSPLFKQYISKIDDKKIREHSKIAIDSVMDNWNGQINFHLRSFENKTNTIITYEYDDDFNKIEKVSTQKVSYPSFSLDLYHANNKRISDYLEAQNIIKMVDSHSVFTAMPLVKTFVNTNDERLRLSSYDYSNSNATKSYKFFASLDLDTYRQQTLQTIYYGFDKVEGVKSVTCILTKDNQLSLTMDMMDENRNAFTQFFK